MSIPVSCSCGQQFLAQPHLAGKQVACPSCGQPLSIPSAPGAARPSAELEGQVVSCECGQSFRAATHLAGKRVPCPTCGKPLTIPAVGSTGDASSASRSAAAPSASEPAPRAKATKKTAGAGPAAGAKPQPAGSTAKPSGAGPQSKAAPKSAKPVEDKAKPRAKKTQLSASPPSDPNDLMWDDALGSPLDDGQALPPGFAPVRRTRSEPIEPMTWYAIYAGIGAVALLILAILGHIGWRAYSNWQAQREPEPAAETAPADPSAEDGEAAEPTPETGGGQIGSDVADRAPAADPNSAEEDPGHQDDSEP